MLKCLPLLSFLCKGDSMVYDLDNAQDNSYRMNVHKGLLLAQKTIWNQPKYMLIFTVNYLLEKLNKLIIEPFREGRKVWLAGEKGRSSDKYNYTLLNLLKVLYQQILYQASRAVLT